MARFLRFLCALAALPFAWALAFVFMDAFRIMPMSGDAFLPPGALWLSGGFLLFFVLWIIRMAPLRVYVLGHELTHALCGLCFGAIPTNLRVGLKGGSVVLTPDGRPVHDKLPFKKGDFIHVDGWRQRNGYFELMSYRIV